jgi:electron transport complex protein RnfE
MPEKAQNKKLSVLMAGLFKENPVLVLVLGTCPTLAVSTMAVNGVGMGIAATVVLVCSNIAISALRNIITEKVRIPCYIVLIAAFVTMVQLIVQAYAPAIDKALGIFLPLIVVNCIILGRAEMFANKNTVIDSALDGLGMGAGFTLALLVMGTIREIIGSGTWFGIKLTADLFDPMTILILAPGGFFVFGCMIAALNYFSKGKAVKRKSFSCEACPMASACGHKNCELEGGAKA